MQHFHKEGSITSVKGIKAAGIFAGIKKKKKDLALIYSEYPATAAGTFTLNKVQAAPLLVSKEALKKSSHVQAVLVNSGNANACTGEQGYADALDMQKYCAKKLKLQQDEVLISSTGVIGVKLPIEKIRTGIDEILPALTHSGGYDAAKAIMTTDLTSKSYAKTVKLSNGEVTIGGICKGSGMIMPNMATMLAFIATDAAIEKKLLQKLLSDAVKNSFNKITVDGDTSTNDMVVLLANGAADISVKKDSEDYKTFLAALTKFCIVMAKSIVSDGEGATKLVTIAIKGAKTEEDANAVAKAISNSPLVKTAFCGEDANWGRILSAAGNSGAEFDPAKVSIYFDDLAILKPNYDIVLDEKAAKEILVKKEYTVTVNLEAGKSDSTWWTCDFSENYIKINANYRT